MSNRFPSSRSYSALHKGTAVLCTLLVLLLGVLAASPELHGLAHGSGHLPCEGPSASDDSAGPGCAVMLLAGGVPLLANTAVLASLPLRRDGAAHLSEQEIFLTAPRYLLQPERGPPLV